MAVTNGYAYPLETNGNAYPQTNGEGYPLGANGDGVTQSYNGEGYVLLLTATAYRKAKKQIKEFPITTPTPFSKSRFLLPNRNAKRHSTPTLRISNIQKSLIFVTYV